MEQVTDDAPRFGGHAQHPVMAVQMDTQEVLQLTLLLVHFGAVGDQSAGRTHIVQRLRGECARILDSLWQSGPSPAC